MNRPPHQLDPPNSYTDQIARVLEQEILEGRFNSDEHLQQDEVCRRFGVSRTPAREALRKLQALGLVELIPNRGALVRRPTLAELREVYQLRAELEAFAAELAAGNRAEEPRAELARAQRELDALVPRIQDHELPLAEDAPLAARLGEHNERFHRVVHDMSGNTTLRRTIEDLQRRFPKDAVRLAVSTRAELERLYLEEHANILEAIERGNAERARTAMREHIRRSEEKLIEFLSGSGFE